jgi:hypothetical protein
MVETGWYRTEGGMIIQMDHPLPEPIAQRVARGDIVRVAGPDGAPYVAPDEPPPPPDPVAVLRAELAEAKAQVEALTAERDELRAKLAEAAPAKATKTAKAKEPPS